MAAVYLPNAVLSFVFFIVPLVYRKFTRPFHI